MTYANATRSRWARLRVALACTVVLGCGQATVSDEPTAENFAASIVELDDDCSDGLPCVVVEVVNRDELAGYVDCWVLPVETSQSEVDDWTFRTSIDAAQTHTETVVLPPDLQGRGLDELAVSCSPSPTG